ncbi:hypothetical protein GCM10008929_20430 [Alkalibacterium psychrotolerans]
MTKQAIEIDVAYNDYFIEVFTVDPKEMKKLIPVLSDESHKSFQLGEKTLFKKDLNSVSIAGHGLGFIYMDVTE